MIFFAIVDGGTRQPILGEHEIVELPGGQQLQGRNLDVPGGGRFNSLQNEQARTLRGQERGRRVYGTPLRVDLRDTDQVDGSINDRSRTIRPNASCLAA